MNFPFLESGTWWILFQNICGTSERIKPITIVINKKLQLDEFPAIIIFLMKRFKAIMHSIIHFHMNKKWVITINTRQGARVCPFSLNIHIYRKIHLQILYYFCTTPIMNNPFVWDARQTVFFFLFFFISSFFY